jgi:hypothetical protein
MINKFSSDNSFKKGELVFFVNDLYDIPAYEIKKNQIQLNIINVESNIFSDAAIMLSPSIGYELWLDIKNKQKSIMKLQNFTKGLILRQHDFMYCYVLTETGHIGYVLKEMCFSIDMFKYYQEKNFNLKKMFHGFVE